jgi:Domain of unknown function (DUF4954)
MLLTKNIIYKSPISKLGYDFIKDEYLPEGKNEYYLRNQQNENEKTYRQLSAYEIEVLVRNRNTSDNWNNILVANAFTPELVKNCKFNGLIRIGNLEPICLSFSDITTPVGLYNSNIISCDFGDNVVVENVKYLSHYIIGNEVMLININEMVTSNHAKFGNGVLKQGEQESSRVWLELCNENAGRKILPFDGLLAGDAFLWSKYRNDNLLMEKFKQLTEKKFTTIRGYYGKVGDRTIIKNTASIKDVWVGDDAYIKGANKLKNLTINSGNNEGKTQIGEGVELVNGIVGYGCKIFYGAKAVRFLIAAHSQLKYGARLINSYLGNNSTISCCEVLNSLIYPFHEQHHNNSFLCASLIMGQSNMAAGATIGSNHNSRGADGEIIAGRGFWPGLCVSLKHNSKFASFIIIGKGDYVAELNITLPFSLVSIDIANDNLIIMPAYWFGYNMYALARNSYKYFDRDKRQHKKQHIEYNYLAPDTINEIFEAIKTLETLAGKAFFAIESETKTDLVLTKKGKEILESSHPISQSLEVAGGVFENSKRKTIITKAGTAYRHYKNMIAYFFSKNILEFFLKNSNNSLANLNEIVRKKNVKTNWQNIGGQLILQHQIDKLKTNIKKDTINSWDEIHEFYRSCGNTYTIDKLVHAYTIYNKIFANNLLPLNKKNILVVLDNLLVAQAKIVEDIISSRQKDYTNSFRQMVYDDTQEMETVLGKLEDNSFIIQQQNELQQMIIDVKKVVKTLK